jgi:hypothetical protein
MTCRERFLSGWVSNSAETSVIYYSPKNLAKFHTFFCEGLRRGARWYRDTHLVLLNGGFLVPEVWDIWLVLLGGRDRPAPTRADHE